MPILAICPAQDCFKAIDLPERSRPALLIAALALEKRRLCQSSHGASPSPEVVGLLLSCIILQTCLRWQEINLP